MKISTIFLIVFPMVLFARKHHHHRVEKLVHKIFKAERRHNGFGKFVGAGDLEALFSQQQTITDKMPRKLVRSGSSNKQKVGKATSQISSSGPTAGWYYGSATSVPRRSEEEEPTYNVGDISQSGPTDGWYYGSSKVEPRRQLWLKLRKHGKSDDLDTSKSGPTDGWYYGSSTK